MNKSFPTQNNKRFFIFLLLAGILSLFSRDMQGQLVADFSSDITEVCTGSTVIFSNNSTGTSDTTAYFWDFGAGASPATSTSSGSVIVTYTGSGSSTVSLVIFENGTSDTLIISGYITVIPLPTANAGSVLTAICQGGTTVALGGSVGGSATGGTWSSSAGGTFSPNANNLNATWTPPPAYFGTATLTLTTTGSPCGTATASKSQVVNPNAVITLTSAAGTNNQSLCINTPITNITYSVSGGGTGAGVTGLPAGVTGSFSAGVFTISGTPTVSGTFNYTVTTTGTCTQASATGTITVNPDAAISLTSAVATTSQSLCINTPIANITYSVSGGGTGAGVSGLPAGVTGSFSAGVFTISGTPSVSGTFNYTVTTTGTCVQASASGSITVIPLPTANAGSVLTAICQGGTTVALGGSVGGSATGGTWSSSAGGTFSPNANTLNATWTPPPDYFGTATLTLTTTGSPCGTVTDSKSQVVNPNAVIALTSAAGTTNQSLCINTPITNITYSVSGGGTGAGVTGLPDGVTGSFSAGTFTISGTPTESGTFNYTVTTTGICTQTNATGTITVNPDATLSLASGAETNNQSLCINTPITNISYSVSGGGTGAGVTGLPAGVTGSFSAGVFTISGTPTVSGTFNYTVTTTGTCVQATAVGTITVIPLPTANAGPVRPAICQGGTTAALGGSVGGSATGGTWSSSAGGTFNPNANTLNATWTPPAGYFGTATLTLTTTGSPCGTATASKSQVVNPNAVITLTSAAGTNSQVLCIFTPITNITYSVSGGGTGAGVTGLPAGVTGSFSAGTFTISGTPTASGTFNYTVTTTGTCTQASASGSITVNPLPVPTASNNGPVCAGSPLNLTGGPAGMTIYSWTGPNSFSSNLQSPAVSAAATSAMAGVYTLTVTNSNGCQNTATTSVTVNPLPVATAGNNSPICAGTSLNLSGGPAGMATYSWSGPNGYTASVRNPVVSTNATVAMSGVYNLTVINNNGCQGSASTSVTVNPLPTATISGNAEVCKDSSPQPVITFEGFNGTAPYTFTYRINDGGTQTITTTVGSSITLTAPTGTPGTYNYSLVSVRDASSTECLNPQAGNAVVIVNPLPTATISGTTSVCVDAPSPEIVFTGENGTPPYTFTYNINSGDPLMVISESGNSARVSVPTGTAGTFTYALLSVRDGSITTCSQVQGGTATVTVNPLPFATITGSTDVCEAAPSPNVIFTGFNGTPPYTFTYTFNGGGNQTIQSSGGNSASLSVSTGDTGTFTYTLVSVEDNSSTGCSQAINGEAVVRVNPLPSASISGTTAVCRNAPFPVITFTGSDATQPYTFTYTINSGSNQIIETSSGNSATLEVPTTTSGVFTYSLVSVREGSVTACSRSQSGSATITVNPLPTATISGNATVCQNATPPPVTFTGSNGTPPYTFTYQVNGGGEETISTTAGNSSVNLPAPTNVAGTFIYTLLSVEDGTSTACLQAQSGSATITVNPLPSATISGTTAVCQNAPSPNITFTGSGGTQPYTFTYSINGGTEQIVTTGSGNSVQVSAPTLNAGVYVYELLSVRDGSSTTCLNVNVSGTATVTVNPLPVTSAISGNQFPACKAENEPYEVTHTPGSRYTWTVPPEAVITAGATGPDNYRIAVSFGTFNGNVSVIETLPTGCSGAQVNLPVTLLGCDLNADFTVSSTSVCDGLSVIFTDLSTGVTGSTTYEWDFGGNSDPLTATGAGPHVVRYRETGPRTIRLTITEFASDTEVKEDYIRVYPLPGATIEGDREVCRGASSPPVIFTGFNGTPPYTFTYNINGGINETVTTTSGSSATLSASTSSPGVFVYNLVSVQDASPSACSQPQAGSATITVNPLPTASIRGTTAVCAGSESPFITFTGANGTPPYIFTYSLNGGSELTIVTSDNTDSIRIAVPTGNAGTFTYNLLSVQDSSSTQCSQPQTGSAVVTVNPLPTATIDGTTVVCQNSASPNIVFTGSSGTAPYTFSYRVNGGDIQTVTSTVGNVATVAAPTGQAGTFTYTLVSVQDASSTSCAQAQSGSATVTVNPLPNASISGTTAVCEDSPFPLVTFTGSNGTAPYTFSYRLNGGGIQTINSGESNSGTLSVPTGIAGVFRYTLVSVRDESSTACSRPQPDTAVVTINPLPTATITGTTAVCMTSPSPNITFTGSNGTAPYTFVYTINSGSELTAVSTGNSATVPVPTGTAGTFTYALVRVTDQGSTNCSRPVSGSATVIVNPLPGATIFGTTSVCMNGVSPVITFAGNNGTPPYTITYRINEGSEQSISTSPGSNNSLQVPTSSAGVFTYSLVSVRDQSSTACSQPVSGSAIITVNPLPLAEISGTTEVCSNSPSPNITFTGSNGTAPYTFTYTINSGSPLTVTSSGNSANVSVGTDIPGTYTYALVSVRDNSSTACSRTASGSATVRVNPLPTATIEGTTTVCQNAASPNIFFTGAGGTRPYTFTYRINGGSPNTVTTVSGNSVSVPVSTRDAGTFTYSLESVQDASSTACVNLESGNAVVTVNPLPTATISGTTAVCRNDNSPLLTFTGSNGTTPYTFTYRINGGSDQTIITESGNSITLPVETNSTGTFTYTLVSVRDGSSTACSQTVTGQTAIVTVNPLPTAIIRGDTTVCRNAASPVITFTGANGTLPYTFTYQINGGVIQTVETTTGSSVNVFASTSLAGTFTYQLLSVRDASSSSCLQAITETAVVTVNPLPTAEIAGSTSVCRNSPSPSVTFTGYSGTPPYTFFYRVNNGSIRSEDAPLGNSISVPVPTGTVGTFNYSLVSVRDGSSTSCTNAASGEAVIVVNPLPVTSAITGNQTPPCEAEGEVYSVTLTPGSVYTWTVPPGSVIVSGATGPNNNTIRVNFGSTNGQIRVRETLPTGCSGTQVSLPISLQGCDLNANFEASATEICNGGSVIFTDLSTGTSAATTYSWNFGTGASPSVITGSGPHTVVYTGTGLRTVSLTITEGASNTETKVNYIRVNPLPTARISGTTAVCRNSPSPSVTFTGADGTPPYTFTYRVNEGSDRFETTNIGNSISIPVPTSTVGTLTYSLVSVRDGSVAGCVQGVADERATITVNPLPTADITTSATMVCRGDAPPLITFTGASGTAPYTFTFNINGGGNQTVSTTGSNNSTTVEVPTGSVGTLTYNLISVRDGSSTSCSQAQPRSESVTVNPLPTATIGGGTTVCKDSPPPNITFTGSNGTSPYTFTYTINSGSPLTVTTTVGNSVTVGVPTDISGAYTYSLVSVQDASETSCIQAQTGSATVIVNVLPTASVTGATTVCQDAPQPSVIFTGANGLPPYTFTYNVNGGINQTVSSPLNSSSVSLSVPTGEAGVFTYSLVSVREGSGTSCAQVISDSAVITINPLPTAEIRGTTSVCRNSPAPNITFTGFNGTAPYTFTYTVNSGSPLTISTRVGNSISIPAPTGTVGTFTYALVSVRDSSSTRCSQGQTGSATVTVNPLPSASISGNAVVCLGGSAPLVTFTGSNGTAPYIFSYRINGGSLQTVTTTSGNSVSVEVPTDEAGNFIYTLVNVRDGSSTACVQNYSENVTITISPLPTAIISGSTETCLNSLPPEITFTGENGTAPFTFTYTINGGSELTVSTTDGNSVSVPVPTDETGEYVFELISVQEGSPNACSQPISDTAVIRVNPLPTAVISGNHEVCRNSPSPSITFTGANGTPPYTFTYRVNNGSNQTVRTTAGNSISVPALTGTPGVFTYSLVSVQDASASACLREQTGDAVVTVYAVPEANAGPGGFSCDLEFQLSAVPSVGTGTWTVVSGPGRARFIPDENSPDAIVIVDEYGEYTFAWSELNGICASTSRLDVVFYRQPVADPGAGGYSCDLTFRLGAVQGLGTGSWSFSSGPGTVNFSPGQNTPDPEVVVSTYGSYIFTWTVVNEACSDSADIRVDFFEQPVADPGTGMNVCGLEHTLLAVPSVGEGFWSISSGPDTAIFTPGPDSPDALVTALDFGNYTFTWIEVNGSCFDSASIDIAFIDAPVANAGTGGETCSREFTLGAVPVEGSGAWSLASGPGNATFTPSSSAPDAMVSVDEFGTYSFTWTVENIVCTSTSNVSVIFRDLPVVSAGVDTIMCVGEIIRLQATGTGSFNWEPDTLVSDPNIPDPFVSPEETMIFTVSLTDQFGCVNYDDVQVTIRENPVPNAGPDQMLEFKFNTSLHAIPENDYEAGVWSLVSGSGDIMDTISPLTLVSELSLGDNIFMWTVRNEVCPPSSDTVTITVNDLVVPTLITPNNDGRNDYLVLRGIENLGRTELVVFDRRGAVVFRNTDYNNDWDGVDNSGNPLPDDTYFMIISAENGRTISSYIVIRR